MENSLYGLFCLVMFFALATYIALFMKQYAVGILPEEQVRYTWVRRFRNSETDKFIKVVTISTSVTAVGNLLVSLFTSRSGLLFTPEPVIFADIIFLYVCIAFSIYSRYKYITLKEVMWRYPHKDDFTPVGILRKPIRNAPRLIEGVRLEESPYLLDRYYFFQDTDRY